MTLGPETISLPPSSMPGTGSSACAIPDAKRGEQLVLITEKQDADREPLLAYARDQGIAELMVPKTIRIVDSIPVLGSGKVDYVGVNQLVTAES